MLIRKANDNCLTSQKSTGILQPIYLPFLTRPRSDKLEDCRVRKCCSYDWILCSMKNNFLVSSIPRYFCLKVYVPSEKSGKSMITIQRLHNLFPFTHSTRSHHELFHSTALNFNTTILHFCTMKKYVSATERNAQTLPCSPGRKP